MARAWPTAVPAPVLPTRANTAACGSGKPLSDSTAGSGALLWPQGSALGPTAQLGPQPCPSGSSSARGKMRHTHQPLQRLLPSGDCAFHSAWESWSSKDSRDNVAGSRCTSAGDSCAMSGHCHRNPTDATPGKDVLRRPGCAYIAESFLFVQATSSFKGLSLEIPTQLRTWSFEHQSMSQLFSLWDCLRKRPIRITW